jgi:hypothetical protein
VLQSDGIFIIFKAFAFGFHELPN